MPVCARCLAAVWLITGVPALTACIRDLDTWVPSSFLQGSHTMVLIVSVHESTGGVLYPYAIALDDNGRGKDPPPLSLGHDDEAYALFFRCPLSTFKGLHEGKLSTTSSAAARPLPPTSKMAHYRHDGGWEKVDALPREIRDLKLLEEPEKCPSFTVGPALKLADKTAPPQALVVPLDDDSALVAAATGPFFRFDQSGLTPVDLPADTPRLAGYRAPDGELWLFGTDGRLVHGRLGGTFVEAARTAPTSTAAIDGPRDASVPFELFLATSGVPQPGIYRASFEHYTPSDEAFHELSLPLAVPNLVPARLLAVRWVGPAEAIAAIPISHKVQWFQNGLYQSVDVPDEGISAALAVHPTFGVVLGDALMGRVESLQGFGHVGSEPLARLSRGITRLASNSDGVAIGDVGGELNQLLVDKSLCRVDGFGRIVRAIVSLPNAMVVVVGGVLNVVGTRQIVSGTDLSAIYLARVRPCSAE